MCKIYSKIINIRSANKAIDGTGELIKCIEAGEGGSAFSCTFWSDNETDIPSSHMYGRLFISFKNKIFFHSEAAFPSSSIKIDPLDLHPLATFAAVFIAPGQTIYCTKSVHNGEQDNISVHFKVEDY